MVKRREIGAREQANDFYKRYMIETLTLIRNLSDATNLLTSVNEADPSIQAANNDRLSLA